MMYRRKNKLSQINYMPDIEPPPTPEQAMTPFTSVGAKMANVFVTPAEVFDEVRSSPINSANWFVPLIVNILAGIIYIMTIYSQPTIIQQLREQQEAPLETMVKQGKMSRQAADQQIARMESFMSPGFMKTTGILMMFFASPAMLFFVAVIFWLVGRFAFGAHFEFMKGVEAIGFASMIGVLQLVFMTLLAVIYGSLFMNVRPVLLIKHFNPNNLWHVFIASLNLMVVWYFAVLAIALQRFTGTRFWKAACWPFGVWMLLIAAHLALVYALQLIFKGK